MEFCKYEYRLTLSNIKTIEMNGDLEKICRIDHTVGVCEYSICDGHFDFGNICPAAFSPGRYVWYIPKHLFN